MTTPNQTYAWSVVIEPIGPENAAEPAANLEALFEPPGDFYAACGWAMDMCDPMIGNHGEPRRLTIERIPITAHNEVKP